MRNKITYLLILVCGILSQAQQCPSISPGNGAVDVPVDATITWTAVSGVIGYKISLGTVPGGEDILNERSAGLTNFFTAPVGMPENTQIYVTVSLFLPDGSLFICPGITFRTEDVTRPPPCTSLSNPINGVAGVASNTDISWEYASTATSYSLFIGTSPGGVEIADNIQVGNVLSYFPMPGLPADTRIYVRIVPANENGPAALCTEERFDTGTSEADCAYIDETTGMMVSFKPDINFPDQVGICLNNPTTTISSTDEADGYRWYIINSDNTETLISESATASLSQTGLYRYVAYNTVSLDTSSFECANSKIFTAVASEAPIITTLDVSRIGDLLNIEVEVAGIGDYEYALDYPQGAYQPGNSFQNIPKGTHTVFVRDRNGCGTATEKIHPGLTEEGFPKFFTPNGDGINDFWQFAPPAELLDVNLNDIHIFDQFGKLLAQISPSSSGWDGNFNGKPLPSSNYWFRATDNFNNEIKGYFALKR